MTDLWIVNAFASFPFKGNPAGVCLVEDYTDTPWMQSIAAELNYSNSAFLNKIEKNKYNIKWFTPFSEAPLCGHATIASMHVMVEEGMVDAGSELVLKSRSGELIVTKTSGWYNLNFPSYKVSALDSKPEFENLIDAKFKFVGQGENLLIMEVENEEVLYSLNPNLEKIKKLDYRALLVTAKGQNYDFLSRYFAPKVGINEDPVCASAHCRLIPYWANKLGKDDLVACQASQRGGLIKCKNLGNRVLISGEAVTVFKGKVTDNQLDSLKNVA